MPKDLPSGKKRAIGIQSANGVVEAEKTNFYQLEPPKENVECYAMEDSPDVLSIGKRCQKYGYGFYWDPYSNTPYMTHPDGLRAVPRRFPEHGERSSHELPP